jgi:hypothetical protein
MKKKMLILVLVACMVNLASAALVAHYTFDEGDAATIYDDSGNGFNAPILAGGPGSTAGNTPYYETGATGSGLALNINDNAYAKPVNALMTAGTKNAITIAFWAKGNSTMGSTYNTAFQAAGPWAGHYNTTQITWTIPGTGGNFTSFVTADFSADQINLQIPDEYQTAWHHYAYVKDTTTGLMQIYVDGDLIVEATDKFGTMSSTPDTYHVGIGGGVYGSSPMDGALDDFYLFDHALTETEIEDLMVPEPLTMTLLGLGGALVLRRRRSR